LIIGPRFIANVMAGGVLELPAPLARLYAMALHGDINVSEAANLRELTNGGAPVASGASQTQSPVAGGAALIHCDSIRTAMTSMTS